MWYENVRTQWIQISLQMVSIRSTCLLIKYYTYFTTHNDIPLFQKYIFDFLQNPDIWLLVLTRSSSGLIQPMHNFSSASIQSKSCYFIRKAEEPITKDNFRNILTFGDIAAKPVDQLAVLVQEVWSFYFTNYQFLKWDKYDWKCIP